MSEPVAQYEPGGCQYCNGSMKEVKAVYEYESEWHYVRCSEYQKLQSQLSIEKQRREKAEEALEWLANHDVILGKQFGANYIIENSNDIEAPILGHGDTPLAAIISAMESEKK